jgi:hypothetical protein
MADLDSGTANTIRPLLTGHLAQLSGLSSGTALRLLSETPVGPMYVAFGTEHVCLILDNTLRTASIACGNPFASNGNPLVATFDTDKSGNLVGGGITGPGVTLVNVSAGGKSAQATPVPGGFVLDDSTGIPGGTRSLKLTTSS